MKEFAELCVRDPRLFVGIGVGLFPPLACGDKLMKSVGRDSDRDGAR